MSPLSSTSTPACRHRATARVANARQASPDSPRARTCTRRSPVERALFESGEPVALILRFRRDQVTVRLQRAATTGRSAGGMS